MADKLDLIPDTDADGQARQKIESAQTFAKQRSPDDAADTFSYAKATGFDFPTAEQVKKTQPIVQPENSWASLIKDHPVLSQALSEPAFAASASDDVKPLSMLERLFGGWDQVYSASKLALEDDHRNQELSAIGRAQRYGTATPMQLKRAEELEGQASKPRPNVGFFPGIVPSVVGGLPGIKRALPVAGSYALAGGGGGALVGAAAGGVGAVPGAVAGFGVMGSAGFSVGMAEDTAKTEQGLAYREYIKLGADPQVAGVAADIVALANGGLQLIPAEKVLNIVPGLGGMLAGKQTRDIMRRLITSNTGRAALARFAGRVAESGLIMALIGGAQELMRENGRIVAAPNAPYQEGNITHAMEGGAQQGLGFGVIHSYPHYKADMQEVRLGEARGEMYKSIAQISTDSKLRERMPEEFKAYANSVIAEHGKVEEAKAPAEALTNLFQKEGITEEQLAAQMPEVARQLKTAKPNQEIVIPMGDLATHLAPLKSFTELQQDLRVGDELTPREAKKVMAEAEKRAAAEPEAPKEGEQDKVYNDVYEKLTNAGQAPEVAQHDAALWSAFSRARAERLGVDPFEYYKQRDVRIGAEMPGGEYELGQREPRLIAQHNLTEENLLHADELGALPVPSIGIANKDHPLSGFGEITLLAKPNLIDPKSGVPVMGADIYSTRHPRARYKVNEKPLRALIKELAPSKEATGGYISDLYNEVNEKGVEAALNERGVRKVFEHAFLLDQGEKVAQKTREVPLYQSDIAKTKAMREFFKEHGINQAFDYEGQYHKDLSAAVREAIKEVAQKLPEEDRQDYIDLHEDIYGLKEHGILNFNKADKFAKDALNVGKTENDPYAMEDLVSKKVDEIGRDKFEKWAKARIKDAVGEPYISKHSEMTGNEIRRAYSVDNIVREMTRKLARGEGNMYGFGWARAEGTPRYRSLEAIQKADKKIVSHEEFQKLKEKMDDEGVNIGTRLGNYYDREKYGGFGTLDGFVEALAESYRRGKSLRTELEASGFKDVPEGLLREAQDFANRLREMPTEYFEAKPQRAVGLHEFTAAVVPKKIKAETRAVLEKHGLKIYEYDAKEGEYPTGKNTKWRNDVIAEAAQQENILFQPAYHGSPYRFSKFTLDHIGSGEGAQVYGHGLYFAESEDVADYYRNKLSGNVEIKDTANIPEWKLRSVQEYLDRAVQMGITDPEAAIERAIADAKGVYENGKRQDVEFFETREAIKQLESMKPEDIHINKGAKYEVDLPEKSELLDYDKKFKQQPEKVRAALQKSAPEIFEKASALNFTGEELYHDLVRQLGSGSAASNALLKAGIPGLKYFDQESRNQEGLQFWGEPANSHMGGPIRTMDGRRFTDVFVEKVERAVKGGKEIEAALKEQVNEIVHKYEQAKSAVKEAESTEREMRSTLSESTPSDRINAQSNAELARSRVYEAKILAEWATSLKPEDFEWQEGTHNFVIWDEDAIKVLNVLEQKAGEGYRGKISFDQARSYFNITLTGKANLSTFLHESGHAFLEFLRMDAAGGHEQSKADFEKLRGWMGAKPGEELSTDQLEQFAKGFETYLSEGRAPAAGLREAFRSFAAWLKLVYRSISGLGVHLNDDVRGVMDRMLASDSEIEQARKALGFEPMKKPDAMSEGDYTKYKERFARAVQQSRDDLEGQAIREFKKTIGEEREKVRSEVEAATKQDPVQNAYEALRTGKRLDGGEVAEEVRGKKISREAVREFPGYKDTPRWTAITSPDGLDPETLAPYYGFNNGEEMLTALAAKRSFLSDVREETERRMREKYPDAEMAKMTDQAIKSFHNEDVSNVLWTEAQATAKYLKGLEAQTLGKRQMTDPRFAKAVIKESARRRVEMMTGVELQPGRFARGEESAAAESTKAFKAGDFEKAYEEKLNQIMQHELWKQVSSAREEVDSIRDYLAKFNELPTRRRMGKAGQMYTDAIDKIISDIELKKQSNVALERRASLASYLEKMEAEDDVITMPSELRSEAALKNYKQMTVEEMRTVRDAVKNIESMARLKNFLYDGREKRDFQTTAVKLGEHIAANVGDSYAEKPNAPQNPGRWEKLKSAFRESRAEKKMIEFVARELDGGKIAGLVHELIFQPIKTAEARKHELTERITEQLLKPLREMTLKERFALDKTVDFLGTPMKMRDVIAVALNMGNEGNKRKLIEGYHYRGWTEDAISKRLGEVLTDKHLDLVQHFWKTIGQLWPEIKELSERTTGVSPPKVEASKLLIRGRELEGGYYPIVYDRERSYKAEQIAQRKEDLFENNFLKPGVSKGFTETRTKFAAPLLLSLNVIPAHINEVVHYLTHYEPVRAIDRLLAHGEVRKSITEGLSREMYNEFRPWLQRVAHAGALGLEHMTMIDRGLRALRVGNTLNRFGFKITSSLMQGLNILSSAKEVGIGNLALGMKRWMEDIESFRDPFGPVYEKSADLRGKANRVSNELLAGFDHFTSAFSEFGHMKEQLGHFSMCFFTNVIRTVDTITWYAAREKAFAEEHPRPEEYADSVVRMSQMGESVSDKARIMFGGEGAKLFTGMYSWYSVVYNQLFEKSHAQTTPTKIAEHAARWWWMVIAPSVAMTLIRGHTPKKDQDEASSWVKMYAEDMAVEGMKPFPIAGLVGESMLTESEPRFGTWLSTMVRGVRARAKLVRGETLTAHEKADLVKSTGILSRMPADAMWNAYKYISAVHDGKLQEPIRDLLFRSPGDWK